MVDGGKVGVVHDVASEIARIDHVQLLLPSRRDDLSDAWKFQDPQPSLEMLLPPL